MLKRMSRPKWIGAALAALAFSSVARADDPVDVALVLAVDVSPSMSYEELKIQREGYAAAIASPDVVQAIGEGARPRNPGVQTIPFEEERL